MGKNKKVNGVPVKKFKPWSSDRPNKEREEDELADILFSRLHDNRSVWDWADRTGLSTTTIRRARAGLTRRPQGLTLQLLARAMGGRLAFVRGGSKQ